ncbi:protein kinase [Actinomadura sp. 6K520]|uniref:protein kinase domain-containing protein n=1 Tax=Actinomadura sp. 6K520 TaxID=2530364 RepID=UPI0014054958|nr:protein kinase [Actinomadura sp. 6K520]
MESGLRLTERYRLVELLEDDGTMEVWHAWDELLGRPVAVKLLAPARTDLHRTFQKGVNRAAGLSHAALETVYDSDQTRDVSGRLVSYVVTEFLSGETLTERLRLGPLTAAETAGICAQVAGALRTAHRAGVPHGDLTTEEIVLHCGDVKVVDTGIGGIVRGARGPSGPEGTLVTTDSAVAEAMASDVRALGGVIAACLPAEAPADLAALAARCAAATAEHGPSMSDVAALLTRDDEPPNAVFGTVRGPAPSHDHRTRTLRPAARPRPYGRHARLAAFALVIAIPTVAAAAMIGSAPRAPVTVPAPSQPRADGPPAPAPPAARGGRAAEAGVTDALGRLRPIVSRGYSSGEIRSDVAIDLNNVITNLENDLTSDQAVDVAQRIGLLREKIVTRERERGLSPGLAAELDRVLATVRT